MAYFDDLSICTYSDPEGTDLAVGWLSKDNPFPTGKTSYIFRLNLAWIVEHRLINQTKGFHTCDMCGESKGSSEIRITGKDGKIYASPSMIVHYVDDHFYKPPQEFIDAVLSMK